MKITVGPLRGYEHYAALFRKVAHKYLEHLKHRSVMVGKLHGLEVVIVCTGFGSEPGDPVDESCESRGRIGKALQDGCVGTRMMLTVNIHDPLREIAWIFAHELAHLLFSNTNDYIGYTPAGECGGTSAFDLFGVGSQDTQWRMIGSAMNEGAAENLARYIVSGMRFSDKEPKGKCYYANIVYESLADLVGELAGTVGDPLQSTDFIDDFVYENYVVEKDDPLYDELHDVYDYDRWEFNRGFIRCGCRNRFWYGAATGTLHIFARFYDELMGAGAFEALNRDFEAVFSIYYSDEDGYEERLKTLPSRKAAAEEKIRRFAQLLKEAQEKEEREKSSFESKCDAYIAKNKAAASDKDSCCR